MKIYFIVFFHYVFYACLHAVRRTSARQAALPYLVSYITKQREYVLVVPIFFALLCCTCRDDFSFLFDNEDLLHI
jgi:hypothetical protein